MERGKILTRATTKSCGKGTGAGTRLSSSVARPPVFALWMPRERGKVRNRCWRGSTVEVMLPGLVGFAQSGKEIVSMSRIMKEGIQQGTREKIMGPVAEMQVRVQELLRICVQIVRVPIPQVAEQCVCVLWLCQCLRFLNIVAEEASLFPHGAKFWVDL